MFSETPPDAPDIQEGNWQGRSIRYRANRIIVVFSPPAPDATRSLEHLAERLAAELPGGRLIRVSPQSARAIISVAPATDIIELASALSDRDDIAYAEPDVVDSSA